MWRCPLGPPTHQLLRTFSLLGRWPTSGSDRAIAHFFIATRNTIKGVGGKNKERTNNMLGLIQAQEENLCIMAFPMCICRLTLTWVSSEISTNLLGMPTHLDRSFLTALDPISCQMVSVLSGVDWPLASPFANRPLQVPFVSLSDWNPLPTFGYFVISSPNPLSDFAPKQTKGSSAWRTTDIVLQQDKSFNNKLWIIF